MRLTIKSALSQWFKQVLDSSISRYRSSWQRQAPSPEGERACRFAVESMEQSINQVDACRKRFLLSGTLLIRWNA